MANDFDDSDEYLFMNGETYKTSLSLPTSMHKALRYVAVKSRKSVSRLVAEAVEDYLREMVESKHLSVDKIETWVDPEVETKSKKPA
jgi:predicted DNA-binding protein